MHCYLRYSFAVLVVLLSEFAFAAGSTSEQDSLEELSAGRIPLQVSNDGKWVVHLDGDSILHRTKTSDINVDQKIMLFNVPLSISLSQDAQKVAVSDGICIRLVNFGEQANSIRKIKSACAIDPTINPTIQEPGDRHLDAAAVALSSDAKQLAFIGVNPIHQNSEIHIIDADTEELRTIIPFEGDILHLQFLQNDTKLLVVQAILGEAWESSAGPSDMQYVVWDLKKRELFSFFHSDPPSFVSTDDFLWSFSGVSGDLVTIKPEDASRFNQEKASPISISRFNVKQCHAQPLVSFVVKPYESQGDEFVEMASDPAGRWLATIEAKTLIVRSFISGEILYQKKLTQIIRSLSSSVDGSALYGVEAGKLDVVESTSFYRGGGKLVQFPLGDALAGLPESKPQNWNDNFCKIENEAANARHIEQATKPAVKLYQVGLGVADVDEVRGFQPSECYSDPDHSFEYQGSDGASSNQWGVSDDGSLWVDRDKALEQLNPVTGKHLRNIPTPRTETMCSLPVFAKQKFFNLVGDKVLAVPFFKTVDDVPVEFAKLEGNKAKTVVRRGKDVGILWKATTEDGNETPVLYDVVSGKVLQTLPTSTLDFEGPSFNYSPPISELNSGGYRWDLSFMGSVRAQYKSPETSQISTVLWDGLFFGQEKPKQSLPPSYFMNNKIIDVGNGKAVFLKEDSAVFYDAVSKRKWAAIPLEGPIDAQWSEKDHVLFIETAPARSDNTNRQWYLHAYKID